MVPTRPSLAAAPLAPVAVATALGVVVDRFGQPWGTTGWAALAGMATVAAAVAWRREKLSALALLVAFLAIGGGWHHVRWSDLAPDDLARGDWERPRPAWLRGALWDVPESRPADLGSPRDEGSTRTVLAVTGLSDGRVWRTATGRVLVHVAGKRTGLYAGMPVQAVGSLEAIEGPLNPGESDHRERWRARGVRLRLTIGDPASLWPDPAGTAWPWRRWLGGLRAWSQERLARGLDPQVAPLAAALLLGRREAVDPEVNDAFARTGTTHLLAISGLHMQALAGLLWLTFRTVGVGRTPAFWLIILATVGYTLLVGFMPSVVRSMAMTVAVCAAGLRNRCTRPANVLAMAGLATLGFNPSHLFDVGCQLSFLCVAALFWGVAPVLRRLGQDVASPNFQIYAFASDIQDATDALDTLERRYEPPWKKAARRFWAWLVLMVTASAVIWLVGLPLAAWRFHLVSPIGVGLNLVLIPITSLALLLAGLVLMLSAVWQPLASPAAWACGRLLEWTEGLVRWGSSRSWGHAFTAGPPWWFVLAFYGLLALAALVTARRWSGWRWPWVGLAAWSAWGLALCVLPRVPDVLEADVLAVGHGLAVVVQTTDGHTLLYDCGRMGDPGVGRRLIAPALWSRGVSRLDMVILSHADMDHYNGLHDLLDRFPIGSVRVPPGFGGRANPEAIALLAKVRARGIPVRPIAAGERRTWGDASFVVRHPPEDWDLAAIDNARSVVLDVSRGGRRLLLTGDLEGAGLAELVAGPGGSFDAVLAPHHGGRTANPDWFYDWAKPSLVIASQRRPRPGQGDALAFLRVPVWRTWRDGAVQLRWEDSGLSARGYRDPGRSPIRDQTSYPNNLLYRISNVSFFMNGRSRWLLSLAGLAAGVLGGIALAVIEWGAWALVLPRRRLGEVSDPPPWRPIEAVARDGTSLRGAWLPATESRGRTALVLHGFGEAGAALFSRAEILARRGWNVVVPDARGFGRSDGPFATFGGREADDLRAWLDALADRVGPTMAPVFWGRSMGAAIALRAAADDPRLRAVVLEAPYLDLRDTLAAWLRRARLPRFFARPILRRAARLAGVALDRPPPIDLAPRVAAPVLILQGTDDPIVPPADAHRLAVRFPTPAEVIEVVGARHADVFEVGGPDLAERVAAFLGRAVDG